jgi:bifunctional DNase/RNase
MKIHHLIKIDENSYNSFLLTKKNIQKTNYSFKAVRINELNYKLFYKTLFLITLMTKLREKVILLIVVQNIQLIC